jgi:hypothetical protein
VAKRLHRLQRPKISRLRNPQQTNNKFKEARIYMYTRLFFISVLLAFAAGCSISRTPAPVADYYYFNPEKSLADIGKVVLLKLDNKSNYPEISADVTKSLFEELQKKQIFSLRVVSDADPTWRGLQLDMNSNKTTEQLKAARESLQCDAIISGSVTQYTPYPHTAIGLQLKMISLYDGQLIWAFEQIWDTSDSRTEYRIEKYLENQTDSKSETSGTRMVNMSNIKFLKFAAYEVANTL